MSISITILGSGAALPTGKRNATAQYILCDNRHILIDCGEGTQGQMRRFGVKLQKLSHIFISHLHGDHYFGLIGLLSTMLLLGRDKGIHIYGPKGLKDIILLQLQAGGHPMTFDIRFYEIAKGEVGVLFEDKVLQINTFPLNHRIATHGFSIIQKEKDRWIDGELIREEGISRMSIPFFRLGEDFVDDDGQVFSFEDYSRPGVPQKKYSYCSDTKYDERIVPYIAGSDLLYHEATFTDVMKDRAKKTYHSTALQAAKIAQLSNSKKLIMGHLSARYDSDTLHIEEARTEFINSHYVKDGDVFTI